MKCNKISNELKFVSCVSDKIFKFSVFELLKFHLSAILPCTCGSYNIVLICHFLCTHTHTHTHTCTQAKFKFFNESIRSNKDSGQIERNKIKYLHYLNKMIKKCKMRKFILSEASCF